MGARRKEQEGKEYKGLLKKIRPIAEELAALQGQARALGIFPNDRELLDCPKCGLQEDVT